MRTVLHTALSVSLYKTQRKDEKSEFWAPRGPYSLLFFFCAVNTLTVLRGFSNSVISPLGRRRPYFLIEWPMCERYRGVAQSAKSKDYRTRLDAPLASASGNPLLTDPGCEHVSLCGGRYWEYVNGYPPARTLPCRHGLS